MDLGWLIFLDRDGEEILFLVFLVVVVIAASELIEVDRDRDKEKAFSLFFRDLN